MKTYHETNTPDNTLAGYEAWLDSIRQNMAARGVPRPRRLMVNPTSNDLFEKVALLDYYNRSHCVMGPNARVIAHEVEGSRPGLRWTVTLAGACGCPDYNYRRAEHGGPCKHVLAALAPDVAWCVLWMRSSINVGEVESTLASYRDRFKVLRPEYVALAMRQYDELRAKLTPRPEVGADPLTNFD